jgi:hypothetical protein
VAGGLPHADAVDATLGTDLRGGIEGHVQL